VGLGALFWTRCPSAKALGYFHVDAEIALAIFADANPIAPNKSVGD
jgi:hypothetical protein